MAIILAGIHNDRHCVTFLSSANMLGPRRVPGILHPLFPPRRPIDGHNVKTYNILFFDGIQTHSIGPFSPVQINGHFALCQLSDVRIHKLFSELSFLWYSRILLLLPLSRLPCASRSLYATLPGIARDGLPQDGVVIWWPLTRDYAECAYASSSKQYHFERQIH